MFLEFDAKIVSPLFSVQQPVDLLVGAADIAIEFESPVTFRSHYHGKLNGTVIFFVE